MNEQQVQIFIQNLHQTPNEKIIEVVLLYDNLRR